MNSLDPRRLWALAVVLFWAVVSGWLHQFLRGLEQSTPFTEACSRTLAQLLAGFYDFFGYSVSLNQTVVSIDGFFMKVAPVGLAGPTMSMLSFPILFYPAPWYRKLPVWLLVMGFLLVLNFLRLVVFGILGSTSTTLFDAVHGYYVFPILFLAAVFLGFEAAVRWMDRSFQPPEGQSVPPIQARNEKHLWVSIPRTDVAVLIAVWVGMALLLAILAAPLGPSIQDALQSVLMVVILGALTFLLVARSPDRNCWTALGLALLRLPDLLRGAVVCFLWIWRPAALPGTIYAATQRTGMPGRTTYLEGWRLQSGWLGLSFCIWVFLYLTLKGLMLAALLPETQAVAALALCFLLPVTALLWIFFIRRIAVPPGIDVEVFE